MGFDEGVVVGTGDGYFGRVYGNCDVIVNLVVIVDLILRNG